MKNTFSVPKNQDEQVDLADYLHGDIEDMIADTSLTCEAKRKLLSSWASDANAVVNVPSLRQLPNGSIVRVQEILEALKVLDSGSFGSELRNSFSPFWRLPFKRRRGSNLQGGHYYSRGPDDDDDPPPFPAVAARKPPIGGGGSVVYPEPVSV